MSTFQENKWEYTLGSLYIFTLALQNGWVCILGKVNLILNLIKCLLKFLNEIENFLTQVSKSSPIWSITEVSFLFLTDFICSFNPTKWRKKQWKKKKKVYIYFRLSYWYYHKLNFFFLRKSVFTLVWLLLITLNINLDIILIHLHILSLFWKSCQNKIKWKLAYYISTDASNTHLASRLHL